MFVVQKIGQLSFVGCTYDWHNHRSGRKMILCITPPIARDPVAVRSTTLRVSEAHQSKIKVSLKWQIYLKELDISEIMPPV